MDRWEAVLSTYKSAGTPDFQKHEDMLARRLLKGAGLNNAAKNIYQLEQAVLGYTSGSLPLWDRAITVMEHAWLHDTRASVFISNAVIDTGYVEGTDDVVERLTPYDNNEVRPLLFARIRNTDICYAYMGVMYNELHDLSNPVTLFDLNETWVMARQSVVQFSNQFAPYDWGVLGW